MKNFERKLALPIMFLVLTMTNCSPKKTNVICSSPNEDYIMSIETNDQFGLSYSLSYLGEKVIDKATLGFEFQDGSNNKQEFEILDVVNNSVNSSWKPVYGERSEYPDVYNEMLISFKSEKLFRLRVRSYNEGVAFRYEFVKGNVKIDNELTEFGLPANASTWSSISAQKKIIKSPISTIDDTAIERPLLVEIHDSLFVAIGEAALVDFARMKFIGKAAEPGTLVAELSSKVISKEPINTPWRFIMAGRKPGQILENNYLLLNLNAPNEINDVSWIKPGKVLREVTLTTQGGRACVDFAAKHNLQYVEFDAGWYGNEYDTASDATTITVDPRRSKGPLDLLGIIEYAKSKDIGIILYVNRRSLEKQLDDVLPLLKSWGVKGVKYGFVNVGSQQWTSWLHDAVRKAAKHELMIDIHDEYRPTGYSRTYPNLMTQEGIRGDEEAPPVSMVTKTIFTRMIAGAGDQTNCFFADRVEAEMGTRASQMAKAICIYSPWQFLYWYDRPEGSPVKIGGAGTDKVVPILREIPELSFYDNLPTVWDDTKVLGGYPGEYAMIARRSKEKWFLGALNGTDNRSFDFDFDFLEENQKYIATIYSHDPDLETITKISTKQVEVSKGKEIAFDILKNSGLAMIITPKS